MKKVNKSPYSDISPDDQEFAAKRISLHENRVKIYCRKVGVMLGLSKEDLEILCIAAEYHDIGKAENIPSKILLKPSGLTDEEWGKMKKHPVYGERILIHRKHAKEKYAKEIAKTVRSHHEKLNGRGYPDGLTSDEISPLAKILAVCDIYDALTSERAYKDAFFHVYAINIMAFEDVKGGFIDGFVLNTLDNVILSKYKLKKRLTIINDPSYKAAKEILNACPPSSDFPNARVGKTRFANKNVIGLPQDKADKKDEQHTINEERLF